MKSLGEKKRCSITYLEKQWKCCLFAKIFKTKLPKALEKFMAENHFAGKGNGLHKVISLSHL